MIKRYILVSKRADLSGDDFRKYYLEHHGAIVAQMPGLLRYRQNPTLPHADGTEHDISGIAEVWYADENAMQSALHSPQGQAASVSLAKFVDVSKMQILPVDEYTILSDGDMQTSPNAEALARQFYEILNTGDMDLLDRTLAPDWAEHPLAPGQAAGRNGYKPIVAFFRTAFPDVHFTLEDVIVAGNKVTVRTHVTGTHSGTFLGVPATGRAVTFRTIDIHHIEGEQITESWHIEDFFTLLQQLTAA